jgi:2-polyprenyl-3-methyl-5-hydroxy-6-metoxy-1,4-benzoquinol methylase
MKTKYQKEGNLIPHYDKHGYYYSPIGGKVGASFLENFFSNLNVDISKVHSVLDLGCGDGRLSGLLDSSKGYVGVDYSNVRIDRAKKTYPQRRFYHDDLHRFIDSNNLRFYDLIVCIEVLEHLEDPKLLLNNIIQRKDKDAVIVATIPINLPYVAHLQTWKTNQEVEDHLSPALIKRRKGESAMKMPHWVCKWV